MRMILQFVAIATLAATSAQAGSDNASPDKLLAGRTPGKPTSCISQTQIVETRTFDDGSIVYRMAGGSDYLNRPPQCSPLRSDRAYATHTTSTQLCSGDILDIFEPVSHMHYGSCGLGEFVPYPRVHKHQ